METFIHLLFWFDNNRLVTFIIIFTIGLIWIYSQIPAIKKKVALPPEQQSTQKEWEETKKWTSKFSFRWFLMTAVFCFALYLLRHESKGDPIVYLFQGLAFLSFVLACAAQLLKRSINQEHINKGE